MVVKLSVNVGKIKRSIKSRVSFIEVLAQQAADSDLYKNEPEVKAEADALVTLGKDLRASDTSVGVAEAALDDAREDRGNKLIACDRGFGTFIAKVEQYAVTPKDLTGLALAAMERQSYKVETPLALVGHYDPTKLHIELEAKMPPGSAGCLIEVSTTPSDPESWKRVKGLARQRLLPGYPPGTYAFRAASVRGNDESDPTTPVTVVVP